MANGARLAWSARQRLKHDTRKLDWSSRQVGLFDSDGDGKPDTPFDGTTVRNGNKVSDIGGPAPPGPSNTGPIPCTGWLTVARGYKASGFNLYATAPDAASTATGLNMARMAKSATVCAAQRLGTCGRYLCSPTAAARPAGDGDGHEWPEPHRQRGPLV